MSLVWCAYAVRDTTAKNTVPAHHSRKSRHHIGRDATETRAEAPTVALF